MFYVTLYGRPMYVACGSLIKLIIRRFPSILFVTPLRLRYVHGLSNLLFFPIFLHIHISRASNLHLLFQMTNNSTAGVSVGKEIIYLLTRGVSDAGWSENCGVAVPGVVGFRDVPCTRHNEPRRLGLRQTFVVCQIHCNVRRRNS